MSPFAKEMQKEDPSTKVTAPAPSGPGRRVSIPSSHPGLLQRLKTGRRYAALSRTVDRRPTPLATLRLCTRFDKALCPSDIGAQWRSAQALLWALE